jgi:predicted phosphoadenosine phosphosulfate sulfurtransferase|tara:strand:+ start:190 stop:453 length:264 start_codon:yes stop_codon:yes gene_type:complete
MNLTMEKVADYIRVKLKQRKERKETRKKLIFKLVKNDHKCRQLRMQLARKNTKALSRQEYLINEEKVKQIIYLTLQQLKIKNTLKYD